MLSLFNTALPMHADRLYASEGSTQAPFASSRQDISAHQAWHQQLIHAKDEATIIQLLNPNGGKQHYQHGIDTYLLQAYIHERHLPAFSTLTSLVGSTLTLSFDTPTGSAYRHLYITAIRQLDHDGSYGYYRLLAEPITYRLHQHRHSHVDTDLSVLTMVAERTAALDIEVIDDSNNSWTPARITQWQLSDWAHMCERLSRQGLTGYLRHAQSEEHAPPKLVITQAYPSDEEAISHNIGSVRFHQVLHDRVQAPVLAIAKQVIAIPASVTMQRFNSASVSHPTQSADTDNSGNDKNSNENSDIANGNKATNNTITLDSPAAFAPVTDTEAVDEALILAQSFQSKQITYLAIAHATDLSIADTFMLTGHVTLDNHYRATHIVHLARNSLAHLTGLTISRRHRERHASNLDSGSHLTQLKLIHADIPWVGALYSRQSLPAMTGITEAQSENDSRNHMTPTKLYILDAPAQAINRLEAQAGANYGTHFTHRANDQTLVQAIGDGEHLINTGSLLSQSRPSLFTTENEQAIESGYRHQADGSLSEWVTDHREDYAATQLNLQDGDVSTTLKMGVINSASGDSSSKREGVSAATANQVSIKTGETLVLSSQAQTHEQSGQHDYQHYTPTLTQTSLGGQHLAERLTQLATGLGRSVKDHASIKTQLEAISDEQQNETHQQTPYTLLDSAADTSYVSTDTLIHRTMGELLTTTQQDMTITSGDTHTQVSSESLNIIADGQLSMTNAKENITLSAHTGKLEATAKQDVNIASSIKEVEIVAQDKITITAGGASITLDGANITIAAKQFTEKAGKHTRTGGGRDGLSLAGLPSLIAGAMYKAQFRFADDDDIAYTNTPYIAINKNTQETFEGVTDDDGQTETFYSSDPDEIKAHLKNGKYKALVRFADDDGIAYSFVNYIAQAVITGEVFEGKTDIDGYTEIINTSIEQEIKVHLLNIKSRGNK